MIAAMLRIKNEARWIRAAVASILPVCERVFVLDDHSSDGSGEICRSFGEKVVVIPSPFEGIDETRDKNLLLSEVTRCAPQWCLCIDGDEILEPSGPDHLLAAISHASCQCYSMRIVYLWNRPDAMRVDGVYGRFWRPSLFRPQAGLWFRTTSYGGHFHCGNVPADLLHSSATLPARLYHLGYMCREDRLKKYYWYNRIDPGNEDEDCYRHMIQGDLPEVPAHLALKHAGPLKIARLS